MRRRLFARRSFRTKMVLVLFGCIAGYLLFTLVMINLLLKPYYKSSKERSLSQNFQEICELDYNRSDISTQLEAIGENNNIRILIVANSDDAYGVLYCSPGFRDAFTLPYDSSYDYGGQLFGDWLQPGDGQSSGDYLSLFTEKPSFGVRTNQRMGTSYLSLYACNYKDYGSRPMKFYYIINTPIAAMDDGVSVFNSFALIIGVFVLLIGGCATFIVGTKMVEPILSASDTAKRMSQLDFSERLAVSSEDEIGQLAESINTLSEQLELKINQLSVANSQLKRELARKDRIDAMRRQFISDVSHELKTPLSIILGYCEGLQLNINDEEKEYYCATIQDEAMRMSKLCMRLLDLAELESGEVEQQMSCFDLGELAADRLNKLAILLDERSVKAETVITTSAPVWGDRDRIEEVINNLLANARNHTPDNGTIRVTVSDEGGKVRCGVYNSGSSIPEESIDRVWESFYKVDKARTRAYGGSGLGLKIVSTILKAHNAEYDVKNLDDGVLFSFTLAKATSAQLEQAAHNQLEQPDTVI